MSEAGEDLHLGVGGEELGALPLHHGLLAALHAAEGGLGQVHDLELLAVGADRHHRHAEALDRAIAAQRHCTVNEMGRQGGSASCQRASELSGWQASAKTQAATKLAPRGV